MAHGAALHGSFEHGSTRIDPNTMKHSNITNVIIQSFYHVYNVLGYGFLERVYQNSMILELRKRGLLVEPQLKFDVSYDGLLVREYFADLFVERSVIVELKAAEALAPEHHAQLLNYIRASGVEVGLLMNFGPKPEFKRKVLDSVIV